jgi:uncharacterized membrane protein required for colicin V production
MDYIVIGLLVLFALIGFYRGFFAEILTIAKWFIAAILAYLFNDELAQVISTFLRDAGFGLDQNSMILKNLQMFFLEPLSFIIIFFVVGIIVGVIIKLLKIINEIPIIGFISRVGGAVVGFLKGYVVVFIVGFLISIIPQLKDMSALDSSVMGWIQSETPILASAVMEPVEMINNGEGYKLVLNSDKAPIDHLIMESLRENNLFEMLEYSAENDTNISTEDLVDKMSDLDISVVTGKLDELNISVDEFLTFVEGLGVNNESVNNLKESFNQ